MRRVGTLRQLLGYLMPQRLRILLCPVLVLLLLASGCERGAVGPTEAGAMGGAALGAGLGAIVGSQTGSAGGGVAIGSAVGAATGGIVGRQFQSTEDELVQKEAHIRQQAQAIQENQRLIDELRRQGADVRSTSRGVTIHLPDILFETGKAILTGTARNNVNRIAQTIASASGDRRIFIEGHTDSIGSISFNQRLSEERAIAVGHAMVAEGIQRNRIQVRGFGEMAPITTNHTAEGRSRNRRVEVIVAR